MAVGAPGHPQLPPATPRNQPPFIASLLLFSFHGDGSNQYIIRTAPALSEKRVGKSNFGIILVCTDQSLPQIPTHV
jgi:hypothetical protein